MDRCTGQNDASLRTNNDRLCRQSCDRESVSSLVPQTVSYHTENRMLGVPAVEK